MKILAIVFTLVFLVWGIDRIVMSYLFSIDISQHLKRAADANTIPIAMSELDIVIKNIESKGLTKGTVSLFLHQPKNDIGFWYNNINNSYKELAVLPVEATPLEKSNMLMKLRETLSDNGNNGSTSITQPEGIAIHPYNRLYFIWGAGSFVLACLWWFFYSRKFW